MKYKQQKLLFLLSQNSRQSLKEIGRELKQSEQTTAYQIKQLETNKKITYVTLTDHILLGNTNLIIGLQLRTYSKENQTEAERILTKNNSFLTILHCNNSCDYLIEVRSRNLSNFNKNHNEFIEQYNHLFKTTFIYPIIVRHSYPRNYLIRKNLAQDLVTLGDRNLHILDETEEQVLTQLQKNPKITILELAKKTKIGIKRATTIKRKLEKEKIIRKYTCFFEYNDMDIEKEVLFVKLEDETQSNFHKLTEFTRQHPNCIELYKLIGEYNVLLVIESTKKHTLIEELRSLFKVDSFSVAEVHKQF